VSKGLFYAKKPNQHKYRTANVGTIDRALRILAGLGLIAHGIGNQSWVGADGLVPLLTGIEKILPLPPFPRLGRAVLPRGVLM
jgi:hypothetical protein